jgi:hypothetical protein
VIATDCPARASKGAGSLFQASMDCTCALLPEGENNNLSPTRKTPDSMRPARIRRRSNL